MVDDEDALTIIVLVAPVKRPQRKDAERKCAVQRRQIHHNQQRAEHHHRPLQQVYQRPLRLVVRIDHADRPRRPQPVHQVLQRGAPRAARQRGVRVQPEGIALAAHLIGPELGQKPAQHGGRGGWQHEPKCASERAEREVCKSGFDLPGAGELERLEGVDEAGEDEEEGHPCLALGYEAEDRALEEGDGAFVGAAAWDDEPAGEAEDQVGGDDEDGGDSAETLRGRARRQRVRT